MGIIKWILMSIIANSAAIFGVAYFLPNSVTVQGGFWGYVCVGITFGILNTLVKPILKLISLPFVIITLGLFLIVINIFILGILEWFYAHFCGTIGIDVIGGWTSYLFAAIALSIFNSIAHWIIK